MSQVRWWIRTRKKPLTWCSFTKYKKKVRVLPFFCTSELAQWLLYNLSMVEWSISVQVRLRWVSFTRTTIIQFFMSFVLSLRGVFFFLYYKFFHLILPLTNCKEAADLNLKEIIEKICVLLAVSLLVSHVLWSLAASSRSSKSLTKSRTVVWRRRLEPNLRWSCPVSSRVIWCKFFPSPKYLGPLSTSN